MPVFQMTVSQVRRFPGLCSRGLEDAARKFGLHRPVTMLEAWEAGISSENVLIVASIVARRYNPEVADHTNRWAVKYLSTVVMGDTFHRPKDGRLFQTDVDLFKRLLLKDRHGRFSGIAREVALLRRDDRYLLASIFLSAYCLPAYAQGPSKSDKWGGCVSPLAFVNSVSVFIGNGYNSSFAFHGTAVQYFKYMSTEDSLQPLRIV